MLKDTANQQALVDKADDLHLLAAVRAFQRIDVPDFFDALPPGFGWNLLSCLAV